MKEITEEMLCALRQRVSGMMSPKRFRHTAAVEEMVARLCALFCPDFTAQMRAAALLHDITKEYPTEKQIELCHSFGLKVDQRDRLSPKTFHARTAAAMIPLEYPAFSDPMIVDAVRWHTTGHKDMTLTEKLLYLADYIDESRTFPACVMLRRYFWGADPHAMTEEERLRLLCDTLIVSYNMTLRDLLEEDVPFGEDTVNARNDLLLERAARG